jgi:lantibiotic modifying enzyme
MNLASTVNKIGDSIINSELEYKNDLLLPNGKVGISLFFYYCGNHLTKDKFIQQAYSFFEESFLALNDFGTKVEGKTFFGGYTGILWLYQHYINQEFIEYDNDAKNTFDVFDELIKKELFIEKSFKNYDLLYGVLGYGVYFLERNKFTPQKENLNEIVDLLDEISIQKDYGIAWEDRIERTENRNKELINLGFAHGIPSIIVFLSYVNKATGYKKSLLLIDQAIQFLKSSELNYAKDSRFSLNLLDGEVGNFKTRLAWCFGDLGIGYALLKSGNLLTNNKSINYGIEILLSLTNKEIADKSTGIIDAGFCHGASGVSHIFFKAYQYTSEEKFLIASNYWLKQALKMKNVDGGYSSCSYSEEEEKWLSAPNNGLLEGSAGVGLCILSRLEEKKSDWDLCFLL